MKVLVVYTSKYGSTKEYAEWIGTELGARTMPATEVSESDISAVDTVIVGGYLHIGKIVGADVLQKYWTVLASKRVVLFSVAGAPAESPERQTWFEKSVPKEIRSLVRHFPLRGRALNLDLKDRMLLMFPRLMMYLKYWKTGDPKDKAAIDEFKPFDGVRKESIAPLCAHIRQLNQSS